MLRLLGQRLVTKATNRWLKDLIALARKLVGRRSKLQIVTFSNNLGNYAVFSRHGAKHWIVPADAWTVFIIISFGVAHCVELRLK